MEKVRGEDGTPSRTRIVWRTKNPVPRSRKRRNPGSDGSVQGFPSEYGFPQPVDFRFQISSHSQDLEERRKKHASEGQNGGQQADG